MAFVEKSGKNTWRVRYWKPDGTHGSLTGYPTKEAARRKAKEIDADTARGTFLDPSAGTLTLTEWATTWLDTLDVNPNTESQYRSLTKNHILPRWGTTSLNAITTSGVHIWTKKLAAAGYAATTIATTRKILSMMLADATDERLIPANPVKAQRRGRRNHTKTAERVWATPEQTLAAALNAAALVGPWAGALMLTAAYTGARWGELTGLQRTNTHLNDNTIVIDPDIGALHETDGRLWLGPPKTAESARTITLPPFLTELLAAHLDSHNHNHVFVTAEGELLRRSNFARRAMRPAADGNLTAKQPRARVTAACPGLTFHGFRHSHKTWLIADAIPEIAQARRLGHHLDNKIEEVYSHIADEVETRLTTALQQRWNNSLTAFNASPRTTPEDLGTTTRLALWQPPSAA